MTDTVFTSIQVSQLAAVVTGGGFKRAAKKYIAIDRLRKALAEKIGEAAAEHTVKTALAAADMDTAREVLRAAIDPDAESDETAERPGDAAEAEFEANGVSADIHAASNRLIANAVANDPELAAKVVVPPAAPKASKPKADVSDKPWYRHADAVDAALVAAMKETGPAKLGAFRAKIIEAHADFAALTLTQQNGILIRGINRMVETGKLNRDRLIFGLREAVAEAA